MIPPVSGAAQLHCSTIFATSFGIKSRQDEKRLLALLQEEQGRQVGKNSKTRKCI
jgi:hypothetical protein